jgi:hypothetical protein
MEEWRRRDLDSASDSARKQMSRQHIGHPLAYLETVAGVPRAALRDGGLALHGRA